MPDESWAHKMIEDLEKSATAAQESVADLRKMLLGNGDEGIFTRLSHLERTDREMKKHLDGLRESVAALRNTVDMVARPSDTTDDRAKWKAIAAWAQPIGTVLAIGLATATAMGWI